MKGESQTDPRAQATLAILAAVRPFFLAVDKVQRHADQRSLEPARAEARLRTLLQETLTRLRALSLSEFDVEDARLALVAFTDERMQQHPGPLATYWAANLWSRGMLGHVKSGEVFYEQLDRLQAEPDRLPVMSIYALALRLGFFGAYLGEDEYRRDELLGSLDRKLTAALRLQPEPLSPRAERPYEKEYDRKRNTWLRALLGTVLVASVAVYLMLWAVVDMEAQDLVDQDLAPAIPEGH